MSMLKYGIAASLTAALGLANAARAQETTLRIADSFPVGHYILESQTKPFMEEVTRATNGKVKFEHYPAEQLGKAKDLMSLTLSGVADIAYVAPSFVSDKLPLSAVAELPESFSNSCQGTTAYWKLVQEGGLLDKLEFAPSGLRVLFVLVLPPYQIYMTRGEIGSLGTLQGKKIRTTGGAKEIAVRKLGAVPIQIPTPEVREAAARGTIDGMLFPHSSIPPYDLTRTVTAATVGENVGSFVATYAISRKKWDALPADVREALRTVGDRIVRAGCEATDKSENADIEKIKAAGVKMVQLPKEEHQKLETLMAEVGKEWARGLDQRGKPGTQVLNAFQGALKQ